MIRVSALSIMVSWVWVMVHHDLVLCTAVVSCYIIGTWDIPHLSPYPHFRHGSELHLAGLRLRALSGQFPEPNLMVPATSSVISYRTLSE